MITVLFFARVKEQLDCPAMELPWSENLADLDALQELLCARGGALWREVLGQENLVRAVNQVIVNGNVSLEDDDEVAFFPPVTGG
jgi:sulfur-carrier protein